MATIGKATPQITAPEVNSGLTYNGTPQQLITIPATTDGGTIEYSIDAASWAYELPTATNAGTYTVYYRAIGNENYEDVAQQTITATITKSTPVVTATEVAEGLVSTGTLQQLIAVPASTSGGTVEYSLDGMSWSDALPTATEAGDYTVYYRVIGDENHEDIEAQMVNVSIAAPVGLRLVKVAGEADTWYTLGGQKLTKQPTRKGTYIYNGKKYVIK